MKHGYDKEVLVKRLHRIEGQVRGIEGMVEDEPGAQGVYHLAVARTPDRARIQQQLSAMGIATGIHYPIPCHRQAPYERFATGPLPVSEAAAAEVLSLPMFPHLRDDQVARVCDAVQEARIAREVQIA